MPTSADGRAVDTIGGAVDHALVGEAARVTVEFRRTDDLVGVDDELVGP